jgi:uncharacterized protein (DUF111 family)
MILASLVDLGVPLSYLRGCFDKLGITGLTIRRNRTPRSGVSCSQLEITWLEARQRELRNVESILTLLRRAAVSPTVAAVCRRVLDRLAEAEAQVHGVPVEQVHFHEVGAVDTIVDVLGFALAVDYLRVGKILFSTLTVGTGTIQTAHGELPVPAPATGVMLSGFQVRRLDTGTEILTPTGCAILTASGRQVPEPPPGPSIGEGFGCGGKVIPGFPDYLRVMHLGDQADVGV